MAHLLPCHLCDPEVDKQLRLMVLLHHPRHSNICFGNSIFFSGKDLDSIITSQQEGSGFESTSLLGHFGACSLPVHAWLPPQSKDILVSITDDSK